MQITLDEGYNAMCDFVYLGYVGEVNARQISVLNYAIPEATAYKLKIEYPDKTVYELPIKNGMCSLGASIFKTACEVKCQIIAYAVEGEVYKLVRKSDIFKQEIRSSIDESGIPSYEESLAALDKILQYESNSKEYAERAEAAAIKSEESEGKSTLSALNANNSEQAAKTSEENAKLSESNSKVSESNAKQSELNAKSSEEVAKQYSADAKTYSLNAKSSEGNAKLSEKNAQTHSESAKRFSEIASTASQNAENSKDSANTYANNAKASASAAKLSETNASKSETATAGYAQTTKTNADSTAADRQAVTDMATQVTADKATVADHAAKVAEDRIATENALSDFDQKIEDADEILTGVEDIKAYLGYVDEDIVGLCVDYKNKTFKRLAGAYGKTAGTDFDVFPMYGGRKRCNVSDDGTINAYYGDENYIEDGTNGQVMVYQPAFFYKVVPLEMDVQNDGIGYHLRKANYYVSTKAKTGFKRHPLFYDKNGEEIEFALLSAFEGSIFDVSADAFLFADEQVMDNANDKFCSIAGAKTASGKTQDLTRPKVEQMSQNRGSDWHGDLIKAESANQLLMIIEMGMMNLQTAIGQGVVSVSDTPNTENNSKATGQTSSLGNSTGQAEGTAGQVSITYRGVENPWGNIWKHVYGVNIWGNGSMKGGVPYICTDFNFAESKNSGNYESAGFTVTNAGGYISAMGYGGEEYDWLFFASECLGNSSVPVGDYHWITQNLNGYRIATLGGRWNGDSIAGGFYWYLFNDVGYRNRSAGGRLVYVPTKATATSYATNITAWNQKMKG